MKVKWLGHACFMIISETGTKIITDPYTTGGGLTYGEIKESADIVTVSHDHTDHNNIAAVRGNPAVVKGAVTVEIKGIKFKGVPTYHDETGGKLRGINTISCFEVDGIRVCHLGDLGHRLSDKQIVELGKIDILLLCVGLLVPVGEPRMLPDKPEPGNYTYDDYIIDANVANQLYDQLEPGVIVPVHFSNKKCTYKLAGIEEFLQGKKNVRQPDTSVIEINRNNLPEDAEIIVLVSAL